MDCAHNWYSGICLNCGIGPVEMAATIARLTTELTEARAEAPAAYERAAQYMMDRANGCPDYATSPVYQIHARGIRSLATEAENTALAEIVKKAVEDSLNAADSYMKHQYGIGAIGHPIDRARILDTQASPTDSGYADRIAKLDAITRHRNLDGKGERGLQQHIEELVALENSFKRCAPQPDPVREPTEAMLVAARDWSEHKYGKPIGNDAAIGCWQVMFDAQAASQPAPAAVDNNHPDDDATGMGGIGKGPI